MAKQSVGWMWIAGALSACSIDRVTFTPGGDAGQDDSVPPGDTTALRCDPNKPFGAPLPITELNTTAEECHATLTADELTVYLTSSRPGGAGNLDIYRARRPDRDAPWEAPELVGGLNTGGHESRPALRPDGLTLYAEVNAISPNAWSLAAATRPDPGADFGPLVRDEILNLPNGGAVAPSILPNGSRIYFARTGDIYHATWTGTGWSDGALVESVNSTETEDYPLIAPDDLTLYFSSQRPGGAGNHDIWFAKRAAVTEAFGAAVPFTEINTADGEFPSWVSQDGCEMWFTRRDGTGDLDLFRIRRPL